MSSLSLLPRRCAVCGKSLLRRQKNCCSVPCQRQYYVGKNNPKYKGGHIRSDGYKFIWVNGKLVMKHRYVMEVHLGRALLPTEVVHHKDGNTLNNSIENLELLPSQAAHMAAHRKSYLGENERQCTLCGEIKPRKEFYRCNKPNTDSHHPHCKKCQCAKKRQEYHSKLKGVLQQTDGTAQSNP